MLLLRIQAGWKNCIEKGHQPRLNEIHLYLSAESVPKTSMHRKKSNGFPIKNTERSFIFGVQTRIGHLVNS